LAEKKENRAAIYDGLIVEPAEEVLANPNLKFGFEKYNVKTWNDWISRRTAQPVALRFARDDPVLLVTGPRQSGKTTLCRSLFPDKPYANLEAINTRQFAEDDPVGFLNQFPKGAILDEVQRVPLLLSEVQVRIDEAERKLGRAQGDAKGVFILTGSHQADLHAAAAQSLAGRVAILKLLPLGFEELLRADPREFGASSVDRHLYRGFYPRVVSENLNPTQAYGAYVETRWMRSSMSGGLFSRSKSNRQRL